MQSSRFWQIGPSNFGQSELNNESSLKMFKFADYNILKVLRGAVRVKEDAY